MALDLDDEMHGQLISDIQSYDPMDNKKYKQIQNLLVFMKEYFGFNEELMSTLQNKLKDMMVGNRRSSLARELDGSTKLGAGIAFNETLKSDVHLNQNSQEYMI